MTPIFGWPKGWYTDNGSHFVNHDVEAVLLISKDCGAKDIVGEVRFKSAQAFCQ